MVVVCGVATGVADAGSSRDNAGLHAYISPPPAVSRMPESWQMAWLPETVNDGYGRIEIVIESGYVQLLASVTCTMYLVVISGVATGLGIHPIKNTNVRLFFALLSAYDHTRELSLQ